MSGADSSAFACPVCASTQARWAAKHRGLRVARCKECGHGYVWPVPDADFVDTIYRNAAYYQGSEGSIGFRDYASLEPARKRMFTRHLMKIEAEVGVGRILDVGCANGDFLKAARTRGWDVFGVDPSVARAQVEAEEIPLVGTTVHDADIQEGSLDAVTFWDVLEHVTDPVADLTRARTLLRPGGVLALTVPDSANVVAHLSGRRWFGYKTAGEHLQFFTSASLSRAFSRAGMSLRLRRPVPWSCTLGFLGDRAGLYLGPAGRTARTVLSSPRFASVVVDMPQINQLALGVKTPVPSIVAQGATP
jgi:2-polyprenyl-3-methyl-5-hydroxy-6-metoxy-1,4-benzoquinol methylase